MASLKFDITGDNSQLLRTLQQTQQSINKTLSTVEGSGKKVDKSFQDMADSAGGLEKAIGKVQKAMGGLVAGAALKEFASQVIETRKEFQSLEVSFSTLLGSAEKGKKMFNDITNFATSTPMLEKDLAKGAQTLLGFGVSAEKVMPYLKQLGDVSMGDSEKFNSLTLAFAQIQASGKLMGQDLLQLINAGFNPLNEISKTTGKSIGELKDEMSEGKISAQMVADAFKIATSEGGKFNGMLTNMSKTMAGASSNLQGAIQKFENAIGEKLEPTMVEFYNKGYDTFNELAKVIENTDIGNLTEALKELSITVAGLTAIYGTYKVSCMAVTAIEGARTAGLFTLTASEIAEYGVLELLQKAQAKLNATMLANPYVVCATAIAALGFAIYKIVDGTNDALEKQKAFQQQIYNTAHAGEVLKKDIKGITDDALKSHKKELVDTQAKYEDLRAKWNNLGNDLNAKKKFVTDNKDAFHSLGFEVNSVSGAEDFLVKNTSTVVAALTARAEAAAYAEAMQEAYKKRISARMNVINSTSVYRSAYTKGGKNTIKWSALTDEERSVLMKSGIGNLYQGSSRGNMSDRRLSKEAADYINNYNNNKLVNRRNSGLTDIDKQTDAQIKALQKEANDAAKKAEELAKKTGVDTYSGNDSSTPTKTKKELEKERKAAEKAQKEEERQAKESANDSQKLADVKNKQIEEQAKQEAETWLNTRQYTINAMKEGTERTLAQIKLDYDKEAQAIENDKKSAIKANEEAARELWEAQNPDADKQGMNWEKYKTSNNLTFGLSDEQNAMFSARSQANTALRDKSFRDAFKVSNPKDILQNMDWDNIFSDLQSHTREYLLTLRTQLQDLLKSGTLTNVEDIEKVQQKITEINGQISSKGGLFNFKGKNAIEDERLNANYENAQKNLIGANFSLDLAQNEYDQLKESGATTAQLSVAEAKLQKAREAVTKATNDAKNAEDAKKKTSAQAVADWFEDAQQFITEKGIDELPDLLDKVGLGSLGQSVSQGLSGFNNASGAAADFANGNYIGAASKGLSALTDFGSALGILGSNDDAENERIIAVNEKTLSHIDNIVGDILDEIQEQGTTAKEAEELRQQALDAITKKSDASLSSYWQKLGEGASTGSHSIQYEINANGNGVGNNIVDFLQSQGIDTSNIYKQSIWGGNGYKLDSIIGNLTEEQASLLSNNIDLMSQLYKIDSEYGSTTADFVEALAANYEKREDIEDEYLAALSGTTYDDLKSSWHDMLMDLESTTEDFSDDINKIFADTLLDEYLGKEGGIYDRLKEWQKNLGQDIENAANAGTTLTQEQYDAYRNQYLEIQEEAEKIRDTVADITGYSTTDGEAATTVNSAKSMTEDTANELVGRMTAIQMSVERDSASNTALASNILAGITSLTLISTGMTSANESLSNILLQMQQANGYLFDIADYSKKMFVNWDSRFTDMYNTLKNGLG